MQQNIKDKFAAILAAQQSKTVKLNTNINKLPVIAKKDEPQPQQLENVPELSKVTIDDIIGAKTFNNSDNLSPFKIVQYSDRSFAIVTDKKPAEEILNVFRIHGTYNPHLKCGKGWIFSNRHLNAVKTKLNIV